MLGRGTNPKAFLGWLQVMRSVNESNSKVFDEIESQQRLSNDFNSAAGRILIVSPYATVHAVQRWRSHLERAMNDRGVSVCAFIQQPRHWDRRHEATLAADDVAKLKLVEAAVELLQSLGVHVTLRPKMHEKLIVIDDCDRLSAAEIEELVSFLVELAPWSPAKILLTATTVPA